MDGCIIFVFSEAQFCMILVGVNALIYLFCTQSDMTIYKVQDADVFIMNVKQHQ